jgi:prepilin-type N-terminal cleavage/methylation domain-containing protein
MKLRNNGAFRRRESGFTLIEVLVSLILLALVLTALPSSIRFARQTWDATFRLDRLEVNEGARDFIGARLSEALPLFETTPGKPLSLLFAGQSDLLSFVAPSPNGPAGPGLYRFELSRRVNATGRDSLFVALRLHGSSDAVTPEEHVLIDDAAKVEFRYLGRKERLGAPGWSSQWTRLDALPDAVELNVVGGSRAGMPTQRILVELRLRNTS